MNALQADFTRWELNGHAVRRRMYGAPTARERELWHALWLLDLGWTNVRVADALERDPHTISVWLADFRRVGPESIAFEQSGDPPRPQSEATRGTEGGGAGAAGSGWVGRGELELEGGSGIRAGPVRHSVAPKQLPTSLHRLGFVLKRPKKRLLKADAAKREAFVQQYVALQREATATNARIFFVDEAHFYADVDLHAKWVLKGEPAFVER